MSETEQVAESEVETPEDVGCPSIAEVKVVLNRWLASKGVENAPGDYRVRRLFEQAVVRPEALPLVKQYIQRAHADAKEHQRKLFGLSLNPLPERVQPAYGYPWKLDDITLQGYLGEVFAGLLAEYFEPFGHSWEIPAFLFRKHQVAFDELERGNQSGETLKRIPGRHGDDCVAFLRDETGRITRVLVCEAKCSAKHSSSLIADAHTKISDKANRSVSIGALIEILLGSGEESAQNWIISLRQFQVTPVDSTRRDDLVVYVCGRSPASSPGWLNEDKPHTNYKGGRRLEAAEIHLSGVADLIAQVYREQKDWDDEQPS